MSIGSEGTRRSEGHAPRGFGVGRGTGAESFAQRREAAQRRLLSSARQVELVDSALRGLDQQLADHGVPDPDGVLRATARALLAVAYGAAAYDVAFAPAHGRVAVRVRHSDFGLEAGIVGLDLADPPQDPGEEAGDDPDGRGGRWDPAPPAPRMG